MDTSSAYPYGGVDDGTVALSINQAPTLLSAAGASARVGTAFSLNVQATGNPTSYGATDLPPGLSLNPASGTITGTPSASGTYVVRLSAVNPGGTGAATETIPVADALPPAASPGTPVITSAAAVGGTVGSSLSHYLYASNVGGGTRFRADNLPTGLALDTASGQIAGTPSAAGTFDVAVSATGGTGTAQAVVRFVIAAAPPRPTILSGLTVSATVGQSYLGSVSTQDTSGPGKPLRYAAANLPPGLGFDTTNGQFGGRADDGRDVRGPGLRHQRGGNLDRRGDLHGFPANPVPTPLAAPPQLNSSATVSAILGTAFSHQLTASNAPTTFEASNLPPGLSLNVANGYLTGTPAGTGVFLVPVTARNAYGSSTGTLTVNVTATALATTAATVPTITSPAAAAGIVGRAFSYQLQSGSAYYGYYYLGSQNGPAYGAAGLPPGLTLDATYGTISGTPTAAGTYPATVFLTLPPDPYAYPPAPSATGTAVVTFVVATAPASAPAPGPPVLTSGASAAGAVGKSFGYSIYASNGPTGYAAAGLPPGLSLAASGGYISGTPTTAGNYAVTLSVTNAAGTTSATIPFVIAATAPAPAFSRDATASGAVGTSFSTSLSATNSPTGYTATDLPPGLSLNVTSGTISGTPTAAGRFAVPISATNEGGTTRATLTINVAPGSIAVPVISGSPAAGGVVGSAFSYYVSASPSPTTYGATNLPPGLTLNTTSGQISGTPTAAGVYPVPLTATNAAGTGPATLTITVAATPPLPVFSGLGVAKARVGAAFSYSLYASNSPTSYSASNLPAGLSLNPANGQITGTPTAAGDFAVGVSATNAGGTASATLTVPVTASDALPPAPVVTSAAAATGAVGVPLRYVLTASDSPAQFGLGQSAPPGLTFDPATGVLSGTPTKAGTFTLPVSATNPGGTGQATLTALIAAQPSVPPVISSPASINAYVGETFYYFITADNNPTTFDLNASLPAGWSFDPATGRLSGTPTATGTTSIPLLASNAAGTGRGTVTIAVSALTSSQSLPARFTSAAAARATTGTAFSYQASATGSPYYYSAGGLPTGLNLNQSTGVISGTTSAAGTYTVTLSAYTNYASLQATLRLIVAAGSSTVPVVTSAAGASGIVGEPFYYYLTASNTPTAYTVGSLPPGLSFDATKALISGTPTASGAFAIAATATNGAGQGVATITLNVAGASAAPPRITTRAAGSAPLNAPFDAAVTVNYSTYSANTFTAAGLPPGLTLNAQSGVISGAPTVAGAFPVTLSASNNYSYYPVTAKYLLTVDPKPRSAPTVSSPAAVAGAVGAPLRTRLTATDGGRDFSATGLPGGLQLDPASGTIMGVPTAAGTFSVPVTATNPTGTGSATLTVVVTASPMPPTLAGNALAVGTQVGSGVVYQIQAANNPATYGATGLPPGLSVDAVSGVITGSPAVAGTYPVAITAANAGGSAGAVVTFAVAGGPPVPVISGYATLTGSVGNSFNSYAFYASNGSPVYAATGELPPGLFLNAGNGQCFGVPTAAGTYSVPVSATNASGTATATLTFLIAATGPPPTFSIANVAATGTVGASFSYSFYGSGSGTLRYAATPLPPGLGVKADSGQILGTPTAAGVYPVTLSVVNANGQADAVVTITITDPPLPAITSAAGAAGVAGTAFYHAITTNGYPASFAASGLPAGLTVNAYSGVISGTAPAAGSYPVTVSATNAAGTGSAAITLTIGDNVATAPGTPLITSPAGVNYSGGNGGYSDSYYSGLYQPRLFRYTVTATNAPASYAAANLPPGLSLNPSTGEISGVPATAGTFTVPISATNAAGTGTATLTINATLAAPVIRAALTAGGSVNNDLYYFINTDQQQYGYYLSASSGYEPIVYRAVGLPPGLSLNTGSGRISGVPSQAGTFPVSLSATNRAGTGRAVVTFAIGPASVPATRLPTLGGIAVAPGFTGVPLTYSLSGGGTYAANGLPGGLSLDPATGRITGTPTGAGEFPVAVSATNAAGTTSATLTVAIAASPGAPVIASAAGATANVGSSFYYAISTAYDAARPTPSGYAAGNLPAGLTLNAASGAISGTPTGTPGTFTLPLSATGGGVTGGATLSLTLLPASPAAPATPPAVPTLNRPAGALAFTVNPFVYTLGSGGWTPDAALPAGLNFDPATGLLSGYPTQAGSYPLAFSATNAAGAGHAVVTLRVVAPDLSLPRIIAFPGNSVTTQGQSAAFTAAVVGAPAPTFSWRHDGVIVPGATAPTLTLADVQPPDAGSYVLTATNPAGSSQSLAATLTVRVTFNFWQAAHFSASEIAAGLAADGADPNGDGVPNLLEYALGRDPRANAGLRGLPVVTRAPGGDRLQLQFLRDPSKTDLDYLVEASTDLRTWTAIARSTAGGTTVNLGGAGAVTEEGTGAMSSVVVQDGQGFGTVGARRFMRLRVVRP